MADWNMSQSSNSQLRTTIHVTMGYLTKIGDKSDLDADSDYNPDSDLEADSSYLIINPKISPKGSLVLSTKNRKYKRTQVYKNETKTTKG